MATAAKKKKEKEQVAEKKKARQEMLKATRKNHAATVRKATSQNARDGRRGQVKVGKLPHWRDSGVADKTWPKLEGFKNVSVCSGNPGPFKQLNPSKLGPICLRFRGGDRILAHNISNLWEFSKVFLEDIEPGTGHPNKAWFDRRTKCWPEEEGYRLLAKRGDEGRQPQYFFWGATEKFTGIQARSHIFCRAYARTAVRTDGYRKLVDLIEKGTNIHILGYEGYDYDRHNSDGDHGCSLEDCLFDMNKLFGHELVIAGLLTGATPWRKTWERGTAPTMIPVPPAEGPVLSPFEPKKPNKKGKAAGGALANGKLNPSVDTVPTDSDDDDEEEADDGVPATPRRSTRHKRKSPTPASAAAAPPPPPPVLASTTEELEAGSVPLAPPPQKRRKVAVAGGGLPIYIIVGKDSVANIPKDMQMFNRRSDAMQELFRDDKAGNNLMRCMMVWKCNTTSQPGPMEGVQQQ